MSLKLNQTGFGHVGLILAVLAVAVIGFSALEVINANNKVALSSNTTATSSPSAAVPNTISSKSDLQQASEALSQSNTQAQAQLDSSSLNGPINQML